MTMDDVLVVPVCKEVVVAEDPMLPKEELPNGADGAACSVGKSPEPTPWATPTQSQPQQLISVFGWGRRAIRQRRRRVRGKMLSVQRLQIYIVWLTESIIVDFVCKTT